MSSSKYKMEHQNSGMGDFERRACVSAAVGGLGGGFGVPGPPGAWLPLGAGRGPLAPPPPNPPGPTGLLGGH